MELGLRPQGGTSRLCEQRLPPDLHLAERKEAGAAGQGAPFSAQNIFCLSSGRLTMHVRTRLPARERRPRVTPTLASSVCESETKTSHTPEVYPPALRTLMSLKHTFIMIFNLSGGFLFPPLFGPGYNGMICFMKKKKNVTVHISNMSSHTTGLVTFWVTVINLDSWTRKYRDYIMPAYHRRT